MTVDRRVEVPVREQTVMEVSVQVPVVEHRLQVVDRRVEVPFEIERLVPYDREKIVVAGARVGRRWGGGFVRVYGRTSIAFSLSIGSCGLFSSLAFCLFFSLETLTLLLLIIYPSS